ncbi:hypothetical protein GT348_08325 [Aristophania vespae]|uniref:Invasion associated locus B family protein n=1 Tax=Aristophania vespae TaxID=2697033 RepID=A0A6P1NH77_9PROT|nr:invasion associated locus B family protein [Aristophania vespae]QHI96227.1 hypothetical protein GT348_08325 [Aristophania vespae]
MICKLIKSVLLITPFIIGSTSQAASDSNKDSKETPPQSSPITISSSIGEWSYRCTFPLKGASEDPQSCIVQQTLIAQKGQKSVPLGMVVLARATDNAKKSPLSKRPWRLTVMAPLQLSLKTQPEISIDNKKSLSLEWQSCVATGCLASLDLNKAEAQQFQNGKTGQFKAGKIVGGGTLTIAFSLNGAETAMQNIDSWIKHPPLR